MRHIIIRAAAPEDIDTLVDVGRRFFDESCFSDVMDLDAESLSDTLGQLIESDLGIVLVATVANAIVGVAGGLVHPSYFNRHHLTGQELFWWVDPAHRGEVGRQLFDALEFEAKARGARSWVMIALAALNPDGVGKLYERRGYRASEHTFIKALEV